jgi:hypothetical protein
MRIDLLGPLPGTCMNEKGSSQKVAQTRFLTTNNAKKKEKKTSHLPIFPCVLWSLRTPKAMAGRMQAK